MLLDDNFVMQGGVRNYLGETKEVKAPRFWKSSKDSPSTELTYITEDEKGLLLDANLHGSLKDGKPNVGAAGLLSFDGWGDTNSDGSSDTSGGNAGAEGGQGSGNSRDSFNSANDYTPPADNDIDSTYTSTSFNTNPEPVEKNIGDKIKDYVLGGGLIGMAIKGISGKLNPENKYENITAEDDFDIGITQGNYTSTPQDYAKANDLGDYDSLDNEERSIVDKKFYDAGFRSESFQDLYSGNTSTVNNLTSSERDAVNSVIPNLSHEVGGTTAQPSMVNEYFKNMGSNLGVSSAYMDTYNAAKTKVSNTLNLTPNTQQYGYGNTFQDNYPRGMTSANPFFDELTTQGLI